MPFEKDFGYLGPFLERLAAAAGQLPDPAAREELLALLRGEQERFARIQALLAGGAAAPRARGEGAARRSEPAEARDRSTPLTVGSLRPRS